MRSVSGLATLGLLLLTWPTRGQEVPELTKARQKVVSDLLGACRKAGAYTVEGKGQRAVVRFDEKKLRAVVAQRRAQVTPELVDALLALGARVDERFQPLVLPLLRACGQEKKDHRALGLAAYLAALMNRRTLRQGEAMRGYQQAAQHFALAEETVWQAASVNNVGAMLYDQGEHEEALKHYRQALAMRQHEVDRLASSAPEDRALNFAASLPLTRDVLLSVAAHVEGSAPATYSAVWPTRSAITRAQERRHLAVLAAAGSPKVQTLYHRLLLLRQQRVRLLLAPLSPDVKARDERLERLVKDIEQVEQDLLPLLPDLTRAEHLAQSTPGHLQKALPGRTAFVDLLRYVHFEHSPKVKGKKGERYTARYVAFVLRRQRLVRVDLGNAKTINDALTLWRQALIEGSAAATRHGKEARRLTWDKLVKQLKGIDTVYLAPDGRLTQLPWAALPGERPGTVLLEEKALAVVPHGAFLLDRLSAPAGKEEKRPVLLAVGAVRYDDRPQNLGGKELAALGQGKRSPAVGAKGGPKWDYLEGTEKELERVKGLAGRFTLRALTGAEASTARLLVELPKARVAHLATHGFFADARFRSVLQLDQTLFARLVRVDDGSTGRRIGAGARSPLVLSGLVLAGANRADTADRGIVSADDLVRLDLMRLHLAVLSACETGLGEVGGGEGVFGLQRAFHIAGCGNVIASLWKVNDEATAALMVLFYRYLQEHKLAPIEALRQAQLALHHNPTQITKWSQGGRGINLKTIYTGSGKPPPEVKASGKTPPRLWAAFSLSGLGR
jgi:CHAT domain-containing protein